MNENITNIYKFIEEKDAELEKLAEEKRTKQPVKKRVTNEESEEIRQRYFCPLCKERPRNIFIEVCGHTFCKTCIETEIKKRNRKCPQCLLRFDKNHFHEINFKE